MSNLSNDALALSANSVAKIFEEVNGRKALIESRKLKLTELASLLQVDFGRISINFGGKILKINRKTFQSVLCEEDKSFFFLVLISGKYDNILPKDKTGNIFFDIDHRYIIPMLNYCSDVSIWDNESNTVPELKQVQKELEMEQNALSEYFPPFTDVVQQSKQIFHDSAILQKLGNIARNGLVDMLWQQRWF